VRGTEAFDGTLFFLAISDLSAREWNGVGLVALETSSLLTHLGDIGFMFALNSTRVVVSRSASFSAGHGIPGDDKCFATRLRSASEV